MAGMWTPDGLDRALVEFSDVLRTAGKNARTVNAYGYRAKRFVRWMQRDSVDSGLKWPASLDAMRARLDRYVAAVRASDLVSTSADSYVDGATRFIDWLEATERSRR